MKYFYISIVIIISLVTLYLIDCKLYDNDLEKDHIRETGLSWDEL